MPGIMYTKAPEADYVEAAVVTTLQIHITQPLPGNVLIFFTGQDEIESALETLLHRTRGFGTKILIYANLPSDMPRHRPRSSSRRRLARARSCRRQHRQDVDHHRQHRLCHRPGLDQAELVQPEDGLIVTPVAKASTNQRAVAPGKCFRLYTKWAYLQRARR